MVMLEMMMQDGLGNCVQEAHHVHTILYIIALIAESECLVLCGYKNRLHLPETIFVVDVSSGCQSTCPVQHSLSINNSDGEDNAPVCSCFS